MVNERNESTCGVYAWSIFRSDCQPGGLLTLLNHRIVHDPLISTATAPLYGQRMLVDFLLSKDPSNFPLTTISTDGHWLG
jgi:hypothetical protein